MNNDGLIVVAVDDEPRAGGTRVSSRRHPGIAQVRTASTATAALELLQADDVDAVFMDIRMPGMDGLALARIIGRFTAPPRWFCHRLRLPRRGRLRHRGRGLSAQSRSARNGWHKPWSGFSASWRPRCPTCRRPPKRRRPTRPSPWNSAA